MAYQIFNIGVNSRRWLTRSQGSSDAIVRMTESQVSPKRSTRRYSCRTRQSVCRSRRRNALRRTARHRRADGQLRRRPRVACLTRISERSAPVVAQTVPTIEKRRFCMIIVLPPRSTSWPLACFRCPPGTKAVRWPTTLASAWPARRLSISPALTYPGSAVPRKHQTA